MNRLNERQDAADVFGMVVYGDAQQTYFNIEDGKAVIFPGPVVVSRGKYAQGRSLVEVDLEKDSFV